MENEEIEIGDSPSERRLSLPERLTAAAAGLGGAIARTAEAAGTMLVDGKLRRRGAEVIAVNASKGLRGIQYGFQSGFQTVQQGPRQLQSVLVRISAQIEEQRMKILLDEEKDAPVDVQVGFQLFEDSPQELRSRLWMALLHHPELAERFQSILRAETKIEPMKQEEEEGVCGDSKSPETETAHECSLEGQSIPGMAVSDEHPRPAGGQSADSRRRSFTEEGEWEVVSDRGRQRWREGGRLLSGASFHRMEPWSAAREGYRQEVQAAMASLPWPIPTEHDEEGRYSTLLQISVGQEETDDVISRDIHRTFPEHPLFAFHQGQQALFRVLKAYSLHDLEVGYCQGMAFVAGLLLFYVPEEPAFQVFCRLLAASGPNLRRHYLPGLHGLKLELCKFEWLLGKHMPKLRAHLEAHGAVPVLFASQWFLSAFSCPFPVSFACRLVDVMLIENSDAVLMRAALAVMAECEAELMIQDTFEDLLTYLKVEPLNWGPHRLRRVLNAALNSPVTMEELVEADAAAALDDHLSLGSLKKNLEDGSRSGAAISEQSMNNDDGRDISTSNTATLVRHSPVKAAAGTGGGEATESIERGFDGEDGTEADLVQHQADLDTAYLQMVLDLDQFVLEETSGEVSTAYENALGVEHADAREDARPL